ncbi:GCN5 family acetyltransferase [Paenibacillus oryzisoli]|uniref:GCN5 family acetyltransferase n=1 Tax=Paenibacillus oryzisoli TaxID=1850517 RepID=A0A198ALT9_9BACL|nr:GNAT family N-acetyltransferase [Paenibacillus oryzisoli]OAS21873.1 GCN5 family acetyltransferase [Paenibacillus oryzisoli]
MVERAVTFNDLKWDTDFFGVTSAKAILHKPLTIDEWDVLNGKFNDYQFVSIENRNSEPVNAQLIGKYTSAYLVDVNIQFAKRLEESHTVSSNIVIHQALDKNDQILKIADFQFSKFTEDSELAKRSGDQVYRQWLINSFGNSEKYFAISKDKSDIVNGFLLHSYFENSCVVELIAVSKISSKSGIGTELFKAVEQFSYQRGIKQIKVGTQVRNMAAINFYYKVGCKQIGCHQVFHLWNM